MADENILNLPVAPNLGGTEQIWIVQGGTDRRTSTAAVAALPSEGIIFLPTTTVTSGASYNALTTDVLIIVQKSAGSPTTINLPAFSSKVGFYYIKDGKGDAASNNITIVPNGADTIDGLASVVISTAYGLLQIAPDPLGGWVIINFG